jgi:hypothetical protein
MEPRHSQILITEEKGVQSNCRRLGYVDSENKYVFSSIFVLTGFINILQEGGLNFPWGLYIM